MKRCCLNCSNSVNHIDIDLVKCTEHMDNRNKFDICYKFNGKPRDQWRHDKSLKQMWKDRDIY